MPPGESGGTHIEQAAMHSASHYDYPNIVPCLVFPFDGYRPRGDTRGTALVFARRGSVVLFAAERTREYGVGSLDEVGMVTACEQFASLDTAARAFLSRPAFTQ
jgi:hypothetical protein